MATIVIKIGSSSLTDSTGGLALNKVHAITDELALLHGMGHRLVLVTSGAVAAGFRALGLHTRPSKIADKQAAAAVGQGLLLEAYTKALAQAGIGTAQILLTQGDFADPRRYKNAHQALGVLLQRRVIPIINENDAIAIEELKVGDNDTLSAQVAAMVQADLLILLTDVDGLYTANPNKDKQARRLEVVAEISLEIIAMAEGAGSSLGTGGMMTKLKAAAIATWAGVAVVIAKSAPNAAVAAATSWTQQQVDGTLFLPATQTLKNKKQWVGFYAKAMGALTVDDGAYQALIADGKSLLLSGVLRADGAFGVGEVVVLKRLSGEVFAKGRVRLSHNTLNELLTQKHAKAVVVHRDDYSATNDILEQLLWGEAML